MEQVYYTQCPMGYGLGATSGFQLKRISRKYPRSGDFRHLAMNVRMAGLTVVSPKTLRYRRDGETAEIAWLAPRAREYEVCQGDAEKSRLTGRPGGLFAHGLRLDDAEMEALDQWPAGLLDWSFWVESDPRPTAGVALEPLEIAEPTLAGRRLRPEFEAVAPLADCWETGFLAEIWNALANAVRQGRTLFLIDESGPPGESRIGELVALLTFAFPRFMRPALTFSTYDDRPENLPGFRIQGTAPTCRPDRARLLALGSVVDLGGRTVEPREEPARWARRLAEWFHQRDKAAWTQTCSVLAPKLARSASTADVWESRWLDPLFGLRSMVGLDPERLRTAENRAEFAELANWAVERRLGAFWARQFPPTWWRVAHERVGASDSLRGALLDQSRMPELWSSPHRAVAGRQSPEAAPSIEATAIAWGEVVGLWFGGLDEPRWRGAVGRFLRGVPEAVHSRFLVGLLRSKPDRAESTWNWLEAEGRVAPSRLLPLKASRFVTPKPQVHSLRTLFQDVLGTDHLLPTVLDVLAEELADRPKDRPILADLLGEAFERFRGSVDVAPYARRLSELLDWALPRRDVGEWLTPLLRRLFVPPGEPDDWRLLRDQTATTLQPVLARVALTVALDSELGSRPFLWAVEELLLRLKPEQRPEDRRRPSREDDWSDPDQTWPNAYLQRLPQNLDRIDGFFPATQASTALSRWIQEARDDRLPRISPENRRLLDSWERIAQARASGKAEELLQIPQSEIPSHDQARWLGLILERLGDATSSTFFDDLAACGRAWNGSFAAGSSHLDELARPLARALIPFRKHPETWFRHLRRLLNSLGVDQEPDQGLGPESLASRMVAETCRWGRDFDPWPLRQFLFRQDAWRVLAADLGRGFSDITGSEAPALLDDWDRSMTRGPFEMPRFFELALNVCRGAHLANVVTSRADALKAIGRLSWWDAPKVPDARDDLRDAVARRVPMDPFGTRNARPLREWMVHPPNPFDPSLTEQAAPHEGELRPLHGESERSYRHFSRLGLARWCCLHALLTLEEPHSNIRTDWRVLYDTIRPLPMTELPEDDRYRFLAWIIQRTEVYNDLLIPRLARWLHLNQMTDLERIQCWSDPIQSIVEVSNPANREGLGDFIHGLQKELRTVCEEARESERSRSRTAASTRPKLA